MSWVILVLLLYAVWLGFITFLIYLIYRRETDIARAASQGVLPQIIMENQENLELMKREIVKLRKELQGFGVELKGSFKKVGLVRYDAFDDVGGGLSFSLALMDDWGNGFILTCLNGRQESRVYAKPLERGESIYALSEEEKEALQKASRISA